MRAVVDDRAHLQRMLDFEVALARAEAAVAVIPAGCVDPISGCLQGRTLRPRGAGRSRRARRQPREPAGRGAHRRGRQDRRRSRPLRALGRQRPGPDRQRAHARTARRHRRADHRPQQRHRRLHGARRPPSPHRRGGAHLAAARTADAVRAQARGLRGGAGALARAAAPAAQGGAGAAIRRRRRDARGARRERPGGRPSGWRRCSTCRRRTRRGTPTATGWRRSHPRSRSSPAPAARSRATSRC